MNLDNFFFFIQKASLAYFKCPYTEMPLSNHNKSGNLTNVKMWLINGSNGVLWCKQVYVH